MAKKAKIQAPTIITILGATGDLMETKIAPALFHLYEHGELPKRFKIVGFSRRKWNDKRFRQHVLGILKKHKDIKAGKKKIEAFLDMVDYQLGEFQEPASYKELNERLHSIDSEWGMCTNKLFYLATPPKFYETIFAHLAASGATKPCSAEEGWTRVLVEKPFGDDLKTAQHLEKVLGKLFKEEQIFRIDHYLGKDVMQNLLALRFSNNLFEQTFNRDFVSSIDLLLLEKKPPVGRGSFYDMVGTLKDVGQNHLLQMLALITMDQPLNFTAEQIRDKRTALLQSLKPFKRTEVAKNTFRAQYDGYTKLSGVKKGSRTETYFKLKAQLDNPRWQGVPIYIESGKGLASSKKSITLHLKHHMPCLCPDPNEHYQNKIEFTFEPEEGIKIVLWTKKPGLDWGVEKSEMVYNYQSTAVRHTEEYEKLLYDCIVGDQTLFVSTKEVLAMWKFVDPVVKGWKANIAPIKKYKLGTNDIRQKAFIASDEKVTSSKMPHEIGIIGLGKMGGGIAGQLLEKGWKVHGFNRTASVTKKFERDGLVSAGSIEELVEQLPSPRVVWMMVPSGKPVDETFKKLLKAMKRGDIIIDGGNSLYKNTIKRAKQATLRGVKFVDVGVSGGPSGARHGACLMIGGRKQEYEYLRPLFVSLAVNRGEQHFSGHGAGHFVKMVHNGIEYGMMQSIAEGFAIMNKSEYKLHLQKIAEVYNHGSVIESRLIGWMADAFRLFGDDLKKVSGKASHSGEGLWTTQVAHALKVPDKVIHESLKARERSQKKPSYQGKIIQALRNQFGGHDLK